METSHRSHVGIREAGVRVALARRTLRLENVDAVPDVLRRGDVLKIGDVIVPLVAVDVIDLHTFRARANEGLCDKDVSKNVATSHSDALVSIWERVALEREPT